MHDFYEARYYDVFFQPLMNEKSIRIGDNFNQISFQVKKEFNKKDIKKAFEYIFRAPVKKVHVVNVKGKHKRFGKKIGKKSDYKKAYISLQEGYELNFRDLRI